MHNCYLQMSEQFEDWLSWRRAGEWHRHHLEEGQEDPTLGPGQDVAGQGGCGGGGGPAVASLLSSLEERLMWD